MTEAKEAKPQVPHVLDALSNILASLSVEKGGTLPSNMGGKSYITASDLNAEIKRQFVEQGLILIPNERVVQYQVIEGSRLTVAIVIEGTYAITSKVDGSQVSVSGIGDGLAIGTAVASNIASTNALKNALLRSFLVTEQPVEDAAKNGTPDEPDSKEPAQSKTAESIDAIKAKIGSYIKDADSPYTAEMVNALGDRIAGTTEKDRKWTLTHYKGILEAIESGEV